MCKTSFKFWLENKFVTNVNMNKFGTVDEPWYDPDSDAEIASVGKASRLPRDFRDKQKERKDQASGPLAGFMPRNDGQNIYDMINQVTQGQKKSDVIELIKMLRHSDSARDYYEYLRSNLPGSIFGIVRNSVPSLAKYSPFDIGDGGYDNRLNPGGRAFGGG